LLCWPKVILSDTVIMFFFRKIESKWFTLELGFSSQLWDWPMLKKRLAGRRVYGLGAIQIIRDTLRGWGRFAKVSPNYSGGREGVVNPNVTCHFFVFKTKFHCKGL